MPPIAVHINPHAGDLLDLAAAAAVDATPRIDTNSPLSAAASTHARTPPLRGALLTAPLAP